MKRFIQQRIFWTLGAAMIFTSSYFFELIQREIPRRSRISANLFIAIATLF